MSKLSLNKNGRKKKASVSTNILQGQQLLSSFFPVKSKISAQQENKCEKKEEEHDLKEHNVLKEMEHDLKEHNVLKEISVFSPTKCGKKEDFGETKEKIEQKLKEDNVLKEISVFSPFKCGKKEDIGETKEKIEHKSKEHNVLKEINVFSPTKCEKKEDFGESKEKIEHKSEEHNVLKEIPVFSPTKQSNCYQVAKVPIEAKSADESPNCSQVKSPSSEIEKQSPNSKKRKLEEMDIEDDLQFLDLLGDLDFIDEHPITPLNLEQLTRCKVIHFQKQADRILITVAHPEHQNQQAKCILLESWFHGCKMETDGGMVTVQGLWSQPDEAWLLTDDAGLLVEDTDLLIGCTSIMSGLRCRRAAVLGELFRGLACEDEGGYMTLGSLLHELTQKCLATGKASETEVREEFEALLKKSHVISDMYEMKHTRAAVENMAESYMSSIALFLHRHANPRGMPREVMTLRHADLWRGTITEVVDIEDTIWAPQLGLKGKVDVTCKIKKYASPEDVPEEKEVVLELKSGSSKDTVAHRGQVMLYNNILTELEGREYNTGTLVYLKESKLIDVCPNSGERRDAIIMRNELAHYIRGKPRVVCEEGGVKKLVPPPLPAPIKRPKECGMCPYLNVCTAYLGNESWPNNDRKMPQQELLDRGEVTRMHHEYFKHWACLVQLEEMGGSLPMTKLWASSPQQREAAKLRCLADLEVTSVVLQADNKTFLITLTRSTTTSLTNDHLSTSTNSNAKPDNGDAGTNDPAVSYRPLTDAGFMPGEMLVLGNRRRLVLVLGSVQEVSAKMISLTAEKDVTLRFGRHGYHLDAYQSSRQALSKMAALGRLMAISPEANKLRHLIINRSPPVFTSNLYFETALQLLPADFRKGLNEEQVTAIKRCLSTKDFALIRGLPGTGKTSTIVALVRVLVALGRSVLVTSHTNSAVDNVLLRLLPHGVPFMRFGSPGRAAEGLAEHCLDQLTSDLRDMEMLHARYMQKLNGEKTSSYKGSSGATTPLSERKRSLGSSPKPQHIELVIGVTCASASHPLLRLRKFDVCIVDEATQVQQPEILPALLVCRTFVLVGDPDQLQPIVTRKEACEHGMQETLFERLATPESTVVLGVQYRMNSELCGLANHLTYHGALRCGNEQTADASFSMPRSPGSLEGWLTAALLPDPSLVFLDTGGPVSAQDGTENKESTNLREVAVLTKILDALQRGGIPSKQVGVMSVFRAQAALLHSHTKHSHGPDLEVSTIDQFQGKDKYVALLSCVRSVPPAAADTVAEEGKGILNDLKRLTVAVTRARVKLIIVGDATTLQTYAPYQQLFSGMNPDHQVVRLTEVQGFSWDTLRSDLSKRKELYQLLN